MLLHHLCIIFEVISYCKEKFCELMRAVLFYFECRIFVNDSYLILQIKALP